ncbi:MAG: HEAT repeat domain-containing protein, partial [Proteobacteria bacterium]|nr:HEAT repeat domain-containing protein [Pseudomonadota bacterium]
MNDRERDSIILSIAMVKNARREFVNDLKRYINREDVASLESLLLAMGALASKSEENIQLDIARFLITAVSRSNLDISITVLIRAMGNTGSEEVVATILQYVDDPVKSIQAAALSALVKFTHLEQVLDDLRELIRSGSDEELLNQVARTLIQGRMYADLMDIDTSTISSHPILRSLVSAALRTNDTDLIRRVSVYLRDLGGELATTLLRQLYLRFRRGTDWDASSRDYDCVASQ